MNLLSNKFIVINSRSYGLFSNFLHTLQHLYLSEVRKRIPIVDWRICWYRQEEPYFGVKANVWEYYFEPVSSYRMEDIDQEKDHVKHVHKYIKGRRIHEEPEGCWDYQHSPPTDCLYSPSYEARSFVNSLIKKYVKIKPRIQKRVDVFYKNNMEGHKILGIHIRGCRDVADEARPHPLNKYVKRIRKYLSDDLDARVFIATDYEPYLQYFINIFKDKVIFCDSLRSSSGFSAVCGFKTGRSSKNRGGPIPGEEVIIEASLLSKCDLFFHSDSQVSSTVLYLNPELPHKRFKKGK
jgi:hypothetical protein